MERDDWSSLTQWACPEATCSADIPDFSQGQARRPAWRSRSVEEGGAAHGCRMELLLRDSVIIPDPLFFFAWGERVMMDGVWRKS